jgi:hypothetical protein
MKILYALVRVAASGALSPVPSDGADPVGRVGLELQRQIINLNYRDGPQSSSGSTLARSSTRMT